MRRRVGTVLAETGLQGRTKCRGTTYGSNGCGVAAVKSIAAIWLGRRPKHVLQLSE
jgi:hypothetical protein